MAVRTTVDLMPENSDEAFMAQALSQARHAAVAGEIPVGAVVVRQGQIVATGHNAPIGAHDPTAHAEIVALRAAAQALGNYRLENCELFVTLEPCAMCSGAMLQARLKRVVFGAVEPKTGAAGSVINLFAQERLNHQTAVQGGVLAAQSGALLQDFFRQRRASQREAARQRHPLRDDALRTPETAFEGLPGYPWPSHYFSDLPALAGLRMHYLDESGSRKEAGTTARTFLCLHDGMGWSYQYHRVMAALLQAGHRVIAPDMIGFGKSDKPKKEPFHTITRHRQILLEFVEKLDLTNVVLVLQTDGDLLGLSLPMAAPQRFQDLWIMRASRSCDVLPAAHFFAHGRNNAPTEAAYKLAGGNDLPGMSAQDVEFFHAPFPDLGHRAAPRAFARMLAAGKEAPATALLCQLRQFWHECWTGRILMRSAEEDLAVAHFSSFK